MTPQAVIFDIGNVLMNWDPIGFYDRAIGPKARQTLFTEVDLHAMNEQIDLGAPFYETIRACADQNPAWATEIMFWHDRWLEMTEPLIPQSIALRDRLRQKGVPVFSLSNFGAQSYQRFQAQLPFLNQFDREFISGQLGVMKPDPAIYEIVERETGIPPQLILFTDDRADNITTAARRGWRTHQFETWQGWARRIVAEGLLTESEAGL